MALKKCVAITDAIRTLYRILACDMVRKPIRIAISSAIRIGIQNVAYMLMCPSRRVVMASWKGAENCQFVCIHLHQTTYGDPLR